MKYTTGILKHLSEQAKKENLDHMIARGNHKLASSVENEETLLISYTKDVERGWILSVVLESVRKINGEGVIPA